MAMTDNVMYVPDLLEKSQRLFEAMGLPTPEYGEYIIGSDGILVFLDAYGVCFRIGYAHTLPYHDRILHPFKSVELSKKLSFEILPIIRQYPLHDDSNDSLFDVDRSCLFLRREFARYGLDFADAYTRNMGFIPWMTGEKKRDILVVLDRGDDCVMPVEIKKGIPRFTPLMVGNDNNDTLVESFLKAKSQALPTPHFAQILAYRDLHEIIARTWPKDEDIPPPAFAEEFWPACVKAVAQGRLFQAYDQHARYFDLKMSFDIRHAAAHYTEHCTQHFKLS
jgi:hypothetical protein